MNIRLKPVTRDNWEEAIKMKVKESQRDFVPSAAVSLAKVYIKPDGDAIEYIPFSIYDNEQMVGFIMHAYEPDTANMYWINGFFIDKNYQGRGYGRPALAEMIGWIKTKFPQCEEIRLTVHKDNHHARNLYKNFGFSPTGEIWGEEEVYYFSVKGDIYD
ncbi:MULTISPECIES: GNAT family N-acetyltransferase [Cytobacillus]|jgi:diamine N-acetyltransferase|uniref:GCN5 family acetyltransferase n=1 Tax=Cytobacillus oceanisediminis 2691 TaxID=1196031 RepID=A0A160ME92_9BACI|nr:MULTISPECIES: GNAT family N-acetyltransferase [Cytobacillus]MBY0155072.1 GNAT family N-acetyltransferase [Cytobacillus firmus]AND40868.1 GCN5 family acetyltransferase [Cytobacillus oceanisediminis 2691]MBU8729488.1 GNAT family N-acetyltransferase [Cytobacillus oceanisediminis]MCM3245304.1 GNAT family N-acetyltransferase [Cytobacillus oceanisediminis]MCM3393368.1 GNAT family N-acetyltransferase [Cytobacillus oceanisediminis]